jgi:hypothetical protein
MILLLNGKETSIPLPGMRRLMLDIKSVSDLAKVKCNKDDQAKVRIHLPESLLGNWNEIRKEVVVDCRRKGLDVAGVELIREKSTRPLLRTRDASQSPEAVLEDYLKRHKDADAEIGRELLEASK